LVNAPLLGRIRSHWNETDEEIRRLYNAIQERIAHEHEQAEPHNVSEATSPVSEATSVEHQSPQPQAEVSQPRASDAPYWVMQSAPVEAHQFPEVEQAVATRIAPAPIQSVPRASSEDEQLQETSPEKKAQSSALIQPQDSDEVLMRLEQANTALQQANSLEAVKTIVDIAAVAHVYAKKAKLGREAENRAAAYCCRASAKLGRMLADGQKTRLVQKRGRPEKKVQSVPLSDSRTEQPLTLTALGLDKRAANQARKLAKFPEPEFESRLQERLDRLELSRTSTLEDPPPPKKEPETSRHFVRLLEDFQKAPGKYDPQVFAQNKKLIGLYQGVGDPLRKFLDSLELEILSEGIVVEASTPATPAS
jgi:hypothetical protein